MAPLYTFISYLALAQSALAATVTLNWDIGYVNGINPDGELSRRVIGINGQWYFLTILPYIRPYFIDHVAGRIRPSMLMLETSSP